jgi:Protein of unknown function (DUF1549)/Protein of unknown function (DUF1553)
MRTIRLALILGLAPFLAVARPLLAGELLPPERTIEEVVDHYVDARLVASGTKAAPETDDASFVRRVTLDLLGRIPTAAETRGFVESTDPEKRSKLVDRLMASTGYVRHQADSLDAMMMVGTRGSLRDYLLVVSRDNRSWDKVFREIMLADESDPARKGSSEFLKARAKDVDKLTTDVSMIFFGVNVSCAKCHDHPLVQDWKQDHFYGMKAFLDRTFVVGNFVGEHGYGSVKFKTTEGVEKKARFLFLTGQEVEVGGPEELTGDARKEDKRKLDEAKKKNEAPPAPEFSARGKLVEAALDPSARAFFSKAIANRLWHRFYGQGLVMPLDQMHSENPPSHPELLDWLARDLVEHGYDLRRLTRGLVLSHAYARESRADSENPDPRLFGVASIRALTPTQLAASMWVATADPASLPDEADLAKVEPLADRGRGLAASIARPGEDYQIGAAEALLMSNGNKLNDLLGDGGDRLVGRLAKIADRRERVEVAVRNILSRPADDEEIAILGKFLGRREDRPVEAARQLIWALLAGSEFRFNH